MTKTVNKTEFTISIGYCLEDESTFDIGITRKFSSESQSIDVIMEDLIRFIEKTTDLFSKLKIGNGELWEYSLHFESFFNDKKIEKFYESLCENLHDKYLFQINCSSDILPYLNDDQRSNMRYAWYWISVKLASKKKKDSLVIFV